MFDKKISPQTPENGTDLLDKCLRAALKALPFSIVEDVVSKLSESGIPAETIRETIEPFAELVVSVDSADDSAIAAEFNSRRIQLAQDNPDIYGVFVTVCFDSLRSLDSINDTYDNILHTLNVIGWQQERMSDKLRSITKQTLEISDQLQECTDQLDIASMKLREDSDKNKQV